MQKLTDKEMVLQEIKLTAEYLNSNKVSSESDFDYHDGYLEGLLQAVEWLDSSLVDIINKEGWLHNDKRKG